MGDIMPDGLRAFAPAFLAVQTLLVYFGAGREHLPAPPALSQFPAQIEQWSELREDPLDPDVANALHADQTLNRIYVLRSEGSLASLFLAWFQTQQGGLRQPHSPKVCLPASGWVPEASGEMSIDTPAGSLNVNRYVVVNHSERAVVLYWYQTPHRAIAGEWASKFWLLADSLYEHRTDTALVRIVVWSAAGGDRAATETAALMARNIYPLLRQQLPQ